MIESIRPFPNTVDEPCCYGFVTSGGQVHEFGCPADQPEDDTLPCGCAADYCTHIED